MCQILYVVPSFLLIIAHTHRDTHTAVLPPFLQMSKTEVAVSQLVQDHTASECQSSHEAQVCLQIPCYATLFLQNLKETLPTLSFYLEPSGSPSLLPSCHPCRKGPPVGATPAEQ